MKLSEAKKIFNDTVESQLKKCESNPDQTLWLKMKKIHSGEVLEAGEEIIEAEKSLYSLSKELVEIAKSALLLHDIGRFHQFKPNGDLDMKIEHGKLGATILLEKYKVENDPNLILPIRYHDKIDFSELFTDSDYKKLSDEEKKEADLICKLVKDADKIANFRKMYRRAMVLFNNRELYINPKMKESLFKREVANNKLRISIFDTAISILCWQFDFHFQKTIEIYKKEKLNEFLLTKMRNVAKEILKDSKNKDVETKKFNQINSEIDEIEEFLNKVKLKITNS